MIEQQAFSLYELLGSVKAELKSAFTSPVWVVAEIMEFNANRTGHCYLELVEKDANSDKIIAKSKATIWAGVGARLFPYFESVTGETLHVGMKILARVTIELHEAYGFSLNIQDVDAQYTLGDIAQQRARVIAQLTADGVIDMNRQLELPIVIQRIAVISSDTAAGWGDFKNQVDNNHFGFGFSVELFPAMMQGDGASASIIDALNRIFSRIEEFDVVAILRGGGAKSDLSCFDQYDLAYNAAQFPLPIITGIGHERDDSVLDFVANVRLKTPTALAAFIIDRAAAFLQNLGDMGNHFFDIARRGIDANIQLVDTNFRRIEIGALNVVVRSEEQLLALEVQCRSVINRCFDAQKYRIDAIGQKLKLLPEIRLSVEDNRTIQIERRLKVALNAYFDVRQKQLEYFEQTINQSDPQNILKRGYAIVRSKDKVIKSLSEVKAGDRLTIQTFDGEIRSIVE